MITLVRAIISTEHVDDQGEIIIQSGIRWPECTPVMRRLNGDFRDVVGYVLEHRLTTLGGKPATEATLVIFDEVERRWVHLARDKAKPAMSGLILQREKNKIVRCNLREVAIVSASINSNQHTCILSIEDASSA